MKAIEEVSNEVLTKDGDTVVVRTVKPGDFVVCNLASLSLGNLPLEKRNLSQRYCGDSCTRTRQRYRPELLPRAIRPNHQTTAIAALAWV